MEKILSKAIYVADYKIKCVFKNGHVIIADFETFLKTSNNPLINKYLNIKLFKDFDYDNYALYWGDNDFDISAESVYNHEFDY